MSRELFAFQVSAQFCSSTSILLQICIDSKPSNGLLSKLKINLSALRVTL